MDNNNLSQNNHINNVREPNFIGFNNLPPTQTTVQNINDLN